MKPEVFLADDYRPAEDEPFTNDRQSEYFKRKVLIWKADLMSDSKDTIEGLQDRRGTQRRARRPHVIALRLQDGTRLVEAVEDLGQFK